jgi:hypothetical protein
LPEWVPVEPDAIGVLCDVLHDQNGGGGHVERGFCRACAQARAVIAAVWHAGYAVIPNAQGSGIWYCRTHGGTVNEDENHGDDDRCPWRDDDDDAGCDWTELIYEATDA